MPKNRKMTYSDHQSQAAREKKEASKKQLASKREDASPADARTVREEKKDS